MKKKNHCKRILWQGKSGSNDFVKKIIDEYKDKSPSIHKLQGNYPSIEKIIEATALTFEVNQLLFERQQEEEEVKIFLGGLPYIYAGN